MSDAKSAWLHKVLGVEWLDLAKPSPAPQPRQSQATTVEALSLERPDKPPIASDIPVGALAALHKQAKTMRDSLPLHSQPDPEAEKGEWDGVDLICKAVSGRLDKRELRQDDIDAANDLLGTVEQAKTNARAAIQTRLELGAKPLRDQAAQAAIADPDAKGAEWSGVAIACKSVTDALPAGKLTKAGVATAKEGAGKIDGAIATARTAIQNRIAAEAKAIRDQLPALTLVDPEARGDEWKPVTEAGKAVGEALPAGTLRNADIDAARQKLMLLQQAGNTARAAIQTRLQAVVQAIRDKITPFRTPHAEAIGTEWDRVTKVCDAAEAALPTGTLTAAALVPESTLPKRIPVVAGVVAGTIQARLRKDKAAVIARLVRYEKAPEPAGADGWGPITEACKTVREAMPPGDLTAAAITEAKRRLDEHVVAAAGPVLQDIWKVDVAALRKRVADAAGAGKPSDKAYSGLKTFIQNDPATKAVGAATGALAPADLATYRRQKAEATRLVDAACAKIAALKTAMQAAKHGADADPAAVGATLASASRCHVVVSGWDGLQARAKAETDAIAAAKLKADEKLPFRTVVAEADAGMKKAAADLDRLSKDLADDGKDWRKRSDFVPKAQGGTLTEEDLTKAQNALQTWNKALDGVVTRRQDLEQTVRSTVATYGGTTAPNPLDVLEAVRDAVARNLGSARAQAIRNNLSQGRAYPLAVWTKALDEALSKQINEPVAGIIWAGRFGMGRDTGDSWGLENTGDVGGKPTHITLYPSKVSASHAGTAAQIVSAIIGNDVNGIHVTQELRGKDDQDNPHVYIGTARNLPRGVSATKTAMEQILTDYIDTLEPIAQEWKDRDGLTLEQVAANEVYVRTIEAEIDALAG